MICEMYNKLARFVNKLNSYNFKEGEDIFKIKDEVSLLDIANAVEWAFIITVCSMFLVPLIFIHDVLSSVKFKCDKKRSD